MSAWKEDNEKLYAVHIAKKDPLNIALGKACEYEKVPPVRYIKLALIDKLTKEGFLTDYVILRGPGRRPNKP